MARLAAAVVAGAAGEAAADERAAARVAARAARAAAEADMAWMLQEGETAARETRQILLLPRVLSHSVAGAGPRRRRSGGSGGGRTSSAAAAHFWRDLPLK